MNRYFKIGQWRSDDLPMAEVRYYGAIHTCHDLPADVLDL